MKLDIWHNILWARYKAGVFTALAKLAQEHGDDLTVFQIAETESNRVALSGVDLDLHRYPVVNLFKGAYSDISKWRLYWETTRRVATTTADVTIVAGFERPEYWLQLLILTLRRRKKAVFCDSTLADNPQYRLKTLVKKAVFSLCDGAFCYGERSRAFLLHHGMDPARIHIRRQAAALPADYDATRIPARRKEMAAPSSAPVFVYIGRLSPEKRIDTLIRAFAKVLEVQPAAILRIVGGGPQNDALRTLAKELGLDANIDFAGSKAGQALFDCYLSASAFVLPSSSEPWGLVVNEALHFGCPVIVSDRCGCVPELVEKSDCGQAFTCDDEDELGAAMLAVPRDYADPEETAARCLKKIASFTPEVAANGILAGARKIAAGA
ncbi:glycosyltransferase [Xanthobacter aminoxidans]|uniref:glycosyltransferase n=1 Tax=Xanthobacter aminoxidans TaxID=186280 RepID=UPI0037271BB9